MHAFPFSFFFSTLPICVSVSVSAGGINPLVLNSLFGGMDLSSLQSLQSLQLAAGLMAFPPTTDPKQAAASAAAASMLPLMLPGMGGLPNMAAALPNMFSLGGLFGGNLATAAASNSTVATASGNTNGSMEGESDEAVTTKRKREEKEDGEDCEEVGDDGEEKEAEGNEGGIKKAKKKVEKDGEGGSEKKEKSGNDVTTVSQIPSADSSAEASINGDTAALLAAAGMSANSLAFNPFLLSTMAPGLLYPSMFLPPGLGGLSLPGFPTASTLAELQSAMAGVLGGNVVTTIPPRDVEEKKGELKVEEEDEDEEEEEGGESDLVEEKEGGGEEEVRGEGSAPADRGIRGEVEEAGASPQKDKSD